MWSSDDFATAMAFVENDVVVPNYVELDPTKLSSIDPSEYTTGEYTRRADLDCYSYNGTDFEDFTSLAHGYTGKGFVVKENFHPQWNQYFFDYPITPVLLSKCYVWIDVTDGHYWAKLDSLAADEKQIWLDNKAPAKFKLPYDTYHFWMRRIAWQKRCMYGDDPDYATQDSQILFAWKNSLKKACAFNSEIIWDGIQRRAFGQTRQGFKHNDGSARCSLAVEFNLATPDDIIHGNKSISQPVQKTMYLAGNRGQQTIK